MEMYRRRPLPLGAYVLSGRPLYVSFQRVFWCYHENILWFNNTLRPRAYCVLSTVSEEFLIFTTQLHYFLCNYDAFLFIIICKTHLWYLIRDAPPPYQSGKIRKSDKCQNVPNNDKSIKWSTVVYVHWSDIIRIKSKPVLPEQELSCFQALTYSLNGFPA